MHYAIPAPNCVVSKPELHFNIDWLGD
jgi:hypothetical protein